MSKRHKKHRSKKKKSLQKHKVSPLAEYVSICRDDMDLLSRYILDYRDVETGGQLFGYWTYDRRPIVRFVLGPGPNAGHDTAFFSQDLEYLRSCSKILKENFRLDHIGEWHSHHHLGLSIPSTHDASNISSNVASLGYDRFLLCIGTLQGGDSSVKAFLFTSGADRYKEIPWHIVDVKNKYRQDIEALYPDTFLSPKTPDPSMKGVPVKEISYNRNEKHYPYWLKDSDSKRILKNIIDFLNNYPFQKCVAEVDGQNRIHLVVYLEGNFFLDISFPAFFPSVPPVIFNDCGERVSHKSDWIFTGDILESFMLYFKKIIRHDYSK